MNLRASPVTPRAATGRDRPRRRGRWAPALVAVAVGLGACAGPSIAPDLSVTAVLGGLGRTRFPAAGVSLELPREWATVDDGDTGATAGADADTDVADAGAGSETLLDVLDSGPAVIALWRAPRSGPAIAATATAALERARTALLAAARRRDPQLRVLRSGLGRVGGDGAVIIDATERIGARAERVRSEHVYTTGGEVVLETYAPPAQFAADDHRVFSPVRRSLRLAPAPAAGAMP